MGCYEAQRRRRGQGRGIVLGTGVDLEARPMMFYVPENKKIDMLAQEKAIVAESTVLHRCPARRRLQIRARRLASITGKSMATSIVTGNTAGLMTRSCYAQIARETGVPIDTPKRELKIAWDKFITVDKYVVVELLFWIHGLPKHKGTPIHLREMRAAIVLVQDVSDTAWGGFSDDGSGTRTLSRGKLRRGEAEQRSTLREVKAAERNVDTFASKVRLALKIIKRRLQKKGKSLECRHVLVYTDNQTAARDGSVGSKDPELQAVIRRIHATAMQHSFTVFFRWRRRDTRDLQLCDDITKIDMCDYRFCREQFETLQEEWGFNTRSTVSRFLPDRACALRQGILYACTV